MSKNNQALSKPIADYKKATLKKVAIILSFLVVAFVMLIVAISIGTSEIAFDKVIRALFGDGDKSTVLIVQNMRAPRAIAALVVGAGLALAGAIMQSVLKNPMASPSTLGVGNAAVFGANFAIVVLGGGAVVGGVSVMSNAYAVSAFALIFALLAVIVILLLSKFKHFSNTTVVLAGLGVGAIFTAATTILQYFSTDTQLTSAVYWSFGDLGRATYTIDLAIFVTVAVSFVVFMLLSFKLNAFSSGEETAKSLGVRVQALSCTSLFIASLITALCVAFFGVIAFVGLMAPQIAKRIVGNDTRFLLPASTLLGAIILIVADVLCRVVIPGVTLPVGAITSLFGGPMFIYILLRSKEKKI